MNTTEKTNVLVQCTLCGNQHLESERQLVFAENGMFKGCPRCSARTYFDIRHQVAWCWSSGLIEMGEEGRVPDGAILIARGPKAFLKGAIDTLARHGQGLSAGCRYVPGIPEAPDCHKARGDRLAKWLRFCAKNNGHVGRHGVVFAEVGP